MTAVAEAQATSKQTQENGYKNRAVVCSILTRVGGAQIEEACLLPEITQYYDPNELPTGATSQDALTNRVLSCMIIHNQGQRLPDVCVALLGPDTTGQ